ncbi:4Fe-4S dicluster domain-containing protein [Candidatus Woesearchaeota archaeon]|nr:4Fe-4S dicluster domain-containing protein [Candidatus Woesearchaeota archaeon]
MLTLKQEKKRFREFLEALSDSYELIAPVKRELVKFDAIKNINDIHFEKNSYFPVKEFFFKKREVLFTFNGNRILEPKFENKERVFFGIRKCDLNAIKHQDIVFMQGANDPYYIAERERSFLLGYHCNEAPSEYCFCGSLELEDYFDMMFYDKGDHMLVEIGSEKGMALYKKFSGFFEKSTRLIAQHEKKIPGADRLKVKDIGPLYDNPDWKKGVDICLSCGACTALCPTCYCFDIHDEVKMSNPGSGERVREWSSCQLPEFSRVAGNHVFRNEREQRFKHRIYHQLDYFKEKYGIQMCVGCGRCIEGCPTRIDFVQIINEMKEGEKR